MVNIMEPLKTSKCDLSRGQLNLTTPSLEATEHSQKVLKFIVNEIRRKQGSISFAEYMQFALYAPGLGYYVSGNQKFGVGGDFITAPELSPLFSGCLAQEISTVLQYLKSGTILEIGAGSGKMAADILKTLKTLNQLPNQYLILELSAELKERQQHTLQTQCSELFSLVHWLDKLPTDKFCGLILANEVCDAMPVHRLVRRDKTLFELCVSEHQGNLDWRLIPIEATSNRLAFTHVQRFLDQHHGDNNNNDYFSEINLNLNPWIRSLSDCLEQGVCLVIDYGFPRQEYYHPDRSMGTLMCHYRHHSHSDPFVYPGLQDITAHVDFTAIAEAAESAELDVLGFTQQASFLISCGLLELAQQNGQISFEDNHAIQILTSPAEMGELFKIMALGKNYSGDLKGFSLSDKRHRL